MRTKFLLAAVAVALAGCAYPTHDMQHDGLTHQLHHGGPLRSAGERTLTGFTFPESVGCDAREGVLYVSQFGGTQLNPAAKDGTGFISKLAPDGRVLEQRAFNETFNKPKGITVRGERLWVTDIDSVWVFNTRTKQGRKLPIPGIQFADDPAVVGSVLYVSDNRSDTLFRIEPADFLDAGVQPKISAAFTGKGVNPNGLWPARDGSLIIVGFGDQPRGIQAMAPDGTLRTIVQPFGKLDGVQQLHDGTLLITDWSAGHLAHWSLPGGLVALAKDFKGPADFCVLGGTVYVPDLVKSEIRMVGLAR
jgi:hypothetical protein